MKPKIITCIGDCGIDRYLSTPLPEGVACRDVPSIPRAGGCTLNVAVNLRRSLSDPAHQVEVISAIGSDADAEFLVSVLRDQGFAELITCVPGTSATQWIEIQPSGERVFRGYDPGVLATYSLTARDLGHLARSDLIVTVIYDQILAFSKAVLTAPRQGKLALDFMDLSDFGRRTAIVRECLTHLDIGFFGLQAHDTALLNELAELARRSKKLLIATLGAAGVVAFEGRNRWQVPANTVEKVIDTTGAGDAFAGAFLASYISGINIPTALERASRHAATIVKQLGAF